MIRRGTVHSKAVAKYLTFSGRMREGVSSKAPDAAFRSLPNMIHGCGVAALPR
jgi:hypothetical protein